MKSIKAIILSSLMLIYGMSVNADNRDNLIYNSEEVNGVVVGQIIYRNDNGRLTNYMQYKYKYDAQQRKIEEECLKWNATRNEWVRDIVIRSEYSGKSITNTYYKWNNKKGEYVLVPEMTMTIDNENL